IRAGNIYVNRNIVGAVVGVQPFGGEGLSGTGPKAGGPLYLLRLLAQCPAGLPDGFGAEQIAGVPTVLPGPTGESNHYYVKPRGTVLCISATPAGAQAQYDACQQTGNAMALVDNESGRVFLKRLPADPQGIGLVSASYVEQGDYDAVLFE